MPLGWDASPFILELDNLASTVSVSWSAQPVETLSGQSWAQIQPSQGKLAPGQQQRVEVTANSLVCYDTTASAEPGHTGAELVSALLPAVQQYHVSVTISGRTTRESVIAMSVVGLVNSPTVTPTPGPTPTTPPGSTPTLTPSKGSHPTPTPTPTTLAGPSTPP